MSGEWPRVKLRDVCERIVDCPHSTPKWTSSGIIVLRNQNIRGGRLDLSTPSFTDLDTYESRSRRARLQPGDLVITREAPMGEVCMIPDHLACCLGQRMVMLRTSTPTCDARYLLFALQSDIVQHEIKVNEGTGSTVSNLRIPVLESLPIPLPPLPEQRRIAKILGDLDDKIELNRKMNETLEQMARALFKSWFVDFDPVRAKMEGRTPTGMDAATAALFPDRLVDSELGMIPEGWEVKGLGEIVECVGGGTPSTKERRYWENGNINWATPKDLASIDVPILVDTERRITDAGLAKVSSGLLPAGTLLMSSRAPVGYLAISTIDVAINQGFIAMLSSDSMSSHYMLQWCTSNLEEIRNRASGTTFAEISKASFRQMSLVLPPSDLMRCYTKAAVRYYDKITSNKHQSRALSTLRDTLLPKLVGGEVRVGVR
jgi:type I restriction enzyme, S subunit